jgi:hypothetical protein
MNDYIKIELSKKLRLSDARPAGPPLHGGVAQQVVV